MISERELVKLLNNILVEESVVDSAEDISSIQEDLDDPNSGAAWVQDGTIFVRDPKGGGSPATITPGKGAELYINGVLQKNQVQVSSKDQIEVKLEKQVIPGRYRLELTKDKMEAYLVIEPTKTLNYKLVNQKQKQHLFLKTTPEEKLESPIKFDQLKEVLVKANVVTGLDFGEVIRLIHNPEKAKVLVARGMPPGLPVDERVEIMYPQNYKSTPVLKEDGTADFHNIKNIYCVEEGALLAQKHSGIPGTPGQNVNGEIVLSKPPRKVVLRAGKGTILSEDGTKVFAQKRGRPINRKTGQVYLVHVEDVLVHEGDVNLRTGNLRFKGSLLMVRGNVHDSMAVQATGLIFINGIVSGARVVAYDNICIGGNTLNSSVSAGIDDGLLQNFLSHINDMEKGFKKILEIINLLLTHEKLKSAKISYGYIFKLILEKKLKEIPNVVSELNNLCKTSLIDLPEDIEKVIRSANKVLDDPYRYANEEELISLLQGIEFMREFILGRSMIKANIEIAGAVNCQLSATGDVTVYNRGCYNTNIYAGGNVKINGVFRGGDIRAGGNVFIINAGTEKGIKTIIEVTQKGVVRIHQCNEGVIIKLGQKKIQIMSKTQGLVVMLDRNGEPNISSLNSLCQREFYS